MTAGFFVTLLLAVIALLLWQLERGLRDPSPSEQKAEAKSVELLLQHLTDQQKEQYAAYGYFDVVGSSTGLHYRISHGRIRNVVLLDDLGRPSGGRCFAPKDFFRPATACWPRKLQLRTVKTKSSGWRLDFNRGELIWLGRKETGSFRERLSNDYCLGRRENGFRRSIAVCGRKMPKRPPQHSQQL
jgi:hypothetical protein